MNRADRSADVLYDCDRRLLTSVELGRLPMAAQYRQQRRARDALMASSFRSISIRPYQGHGG